MKKIVTLIAACALIISACEDPVSSGTAKLPSLTIKNESSFDLTNVKFSGISFTAPNSSDLPKTTQAVKELTEQDLNKAGYITFTRKDIGIACRTEAVSVSDQDVTFTFLDTTIVEEVANSSNKKPLGQISFVSKLGIERGGLTVARNDSVNLGEGSITSAVPKQTEFILKNTGVGKLLLTGNEPVKVSGDTEVFTVIQPASSEAAPNGSLTFKINFKPTEAQFYSSTVTVSSNDPSGDFAFTINGTGVAPKPIAGIFYGDTEIDQNGTIHVSGETITTQSKNIEIIIKNTGDEVLTIDTSAITITGADASAFTKSTDPGTNISPGTQSQFIIQCNTNKAGENDATLTIPTNDRSRNPIIVYLRVPAIKGSALLELSQGTTLIEDNAITPFNFGSVEAGTSKNLQFTIKNTGNIPLQLTGTPAVESSNAVFTIPTQPANKTIPPGDTVSFIIRYSPTAEKEDFADITIINNSGSGLFSCKVTGSGYEKKPQITLRQDTTAIAVNDELPLGSIPTGKTKDVVFTIGNSGDANLTFTDGTNRVTLTDPAGGQASITVQPSSASIAPGGTATFTLRFIPTAVGDFSARVQIKTNSRNNSDFSFTVKGSARAASTEARLSKLDISEGALAPVFNRDTYSYNVTLQPGPTKVNLTPTGVDPKVTRITVNGVSQASGVQSQDINLAPNTTVTIIVTAEDGIATATYTIAIKLLSNVTTLKISNQSSSELTEVRWQSVTFSNNDYEDAMRTGTAVSQTVSADAGYIFFKRKSNPITARTADPIIIGKGETYEFTFTNTTEIVEVKNTNNTGQLGTLQATVVWFDDAEGEMQPYYEMVSTDYSTGYQKNGEKGLVIDGTNGKLRLKIKLDRTATVSFWFKHTNNWDNEDYQYATFSINGKVQERWITSTDWSFREYSLSGEIDLVWEKHGYGDLCLDDILIYYPN